MTQHHLGYKDDAEKSLAAALLWFVNTEPFAAGGSWFWCDQIRMRRLRDEAVALIRSSDALPKGLGQGWHFKGRAYFKMKQWSKALADFNKAVDLGVQDEPIWSERGYAHGMLGDYRSAAADYARAVETRPTNPQLWLCHAFAKLGCDDLDGYHQVCAGMRSRFGMSTDTYTANRLAQIHFAVDGAHADAGALVRWARAAQPNPRDRRVLGPALYREGQYEAAVRHFQEFAKTTPLLGDEELFLAMAQHRQGMVAEAEATLAKAVKWIEGLERTAAGGGHWTWYHLVYAKRLQTEAEALIHGK